MMDPGMILAATAGLVGSCVAQKCADATLELVWQKLKARFGQTTGRDPQPADLAGTPLWVDDSTREELERLFGSSTALRRAQRDSDALSGAKALWIDDHPDNNIWERAMLGAFGVQFELARTTHEGQAALRRASFDVILSDIERHGVVDEGIRALPLLRVQSPETSVVFYTGHVRRDLPLPVGAFGMADRPDQLLHLVLDVVERTRV